MKAKILILTLILISTVGFIAAQPGPPASHGSTGDEAPEGGGAPLTGGVALLVAMGAAYGARKFYMNKKKDDL